MEKKTSYKQYFQSESEEESEDENDKSKRSSRLERAQNRGQTKSTGRRRKNSSDSEVIAEESDEEEISDEEGDESKEWDDMCFVCGKGGNVLCCETCTHVCHLQCTGLKKPPQGDWHCEDCLVKLSQKRTTRGQTNSYNKAAPKTRGRY